MSLSLSNSRVEDARSRPERLKCPEHFQNRINQVGGFNRYGQPNFRLVWAQTETTWQGGEWEAEGETYRGYREILLGDGLPHWMLVQWCDAGKSIEMPHAMPENYISFYENNRCAKTGLCLLGEYPYRGSYRIALNLMAKWFDQAGMHIRAFPLSTEIVNMMIPIIKASMFLSVEAKMRYLKECDEKDEADRSRAFDDAYHSAKLPRNLTLEGTRMVQQKLDSIEKAFNAALITRMARDRVFQRQTRLGDPHAR